MIKLVILIVYGVEDKLQGYEVNYSGAHNGLTTPNGAIRFMNIRPN